MSIKINKLTPDNLNYYIKYQENHCKDVINSMKIGHIGDYVKVKLGALLGMHQIYGIIIELSKVSNYVNIIYFSPLGRKYSLSGISTYNYTVIEKEAYVDDELYKAFEDYIIKNCFNICTKEFEDGYCKYMEEIRNMRNNKQTPLTDEIVKIAQENKKPIILKDTYQIGELYINPNYGKTWSRKITEEDVIYTVIEDGDAATSTSFTIEQAKELMSNLQDIIDWYESEPEPKCKISDRVSIISGIFVGYTGEVLDIDKYGKDKPLVIKLDDNEDFNGCTCFVGYDDVEVVEDEDNK
jgi:transcription antitermination factor NusG